MKNFILNTITFLITIGLAITIFIYQGKYEEQKDRAIQAESKVADLKGELAAAKDNQPDQMKRLAEDFTRELFSFNVNSSEKRLKALQEMSAGKARNKLQTAKNDTYEKNLSQFKDNLVAEVHVKDSIYNKISNQQGKVQVEFQQWIISGGITDKRVIVMNVDLEYIQGKWKAIDFEIKNIV